MHASIDASHAPVAGQTCYAAGCHTATGTDSLAQTHRSAEATLGGELRTELPGLPLGRHAGKPCVRQLSRRQGRRQPRLQRSHPYRGRLVRGFVSLQALGAVHPAKQLHVVPHRHGRGDPAVGRSKCSACHSTTAHTPPGGSHVGDEVGAGSGYGRADAAVLHGQGLPQHHDVSVLHANVHDGSGGCSICHASGVTPTHHLRQLPPERCARRHELDAPRQQEVPARLERRHRWCVLRPGRPRRVGRQPATTTTASTATWTSSAALRTCTRSRSRSTRARRCGTRA